MIYCPIRRENVAALPEELIRQRFILFMLQERGFPASLVTVEKSLRQLPHLSPLERQAAPCRRADILCFAKGICGAAFHPLLLVECKAVKLTKRALNQVIGYNHHVRSCFIAIVNDQEMCLGWFDKAKGEYSFIEDLPPYNELLLLAGQAS